MKPTLFAFLSIFSFATVLSACTDPGEADLGETDYDTETETTQSEQISPEMTDDADRQSTFGGGQGSDVAEDTQEEVDLPEEAPAAGGQQSPDTETDTGIGSGSETESESEVEMETEQQSPDSQQPSTGN